MKLTLNALLKRFPITAGIIVVALSLGAWRLIVNDQVILLVSLLYAVALYRHFLKDGMFDDK